MNNLSIKKILIALVVIAIVVIVVALGAAKFSQKKPVATQAPTTSSISNVAAVQKTEVDKSKLPASFPSDIPLEAGATITQNYNAKSDSGGFQATRSFETKKTLAENLTLYQNFLKGTTWKINNTIDQPAYKVIFASQTNKNLQISMSENPNTKVRTVNISYTEFPK